MVSPRPNYKLVFALSLLVAGLLSIGGFASYGLLKTNCREIVSRQQYAMVTALAEEMNDKMLAAQKELSALAGSIPEEAFANAKLLQGFIDARHQVYPHFYNEIVVFSPQGRVVAGEHVEPSMRSMDVSSRDFFTNTVKTGQPCIFGPLESLHLHRHPVIIYTVPLYSARGSLTAIVAGVQDLLDDRVFGSLAPKTGSKGYIYIFSPDRTLVSHPDRSRIMKKDVLPGANPLFDKAIGGFEGTGETVTSRGVQVLSSFTRLKSTGWIVAASLPLDEVYAPAARSGRYLLLGVGAMILLSCVLIRGGLSRPVVRLLLVRQGASPSAPDGADEEERLAGVEEALRQTNETLQTLIEASPLAIVMTDTEENVLLWNGAAQRLLGWSDEEVLGGPIPNISAEQHEQERAQMARVLAGETLTGMEVPRRNKDGTLVDISLAAAPLSNSHGKVVGIMTILADMTERKLAEQALRRSKEETEAMMADLEESNRSLRLAMERTAQLAGEADSANRAKSQFLANMSHEIRTPLNGIIGMTELALDSDLSPEQRENLEMVRQSGETLLSLINEILDFTKIEAGKLELEEVDFDLADVTDAALCVLLPQARRKEIRLACTIDPGVPRMLKGDPARLRELLINLAGNAVKFTERGEVTITVERARQADMSHPETDGLHIAVRDTGIGIAPEKVSLIFDSFTQADGSTTRKYGGTGLGLAIAKRVVEMMRGRIWLETRLGEGSVFHVDIPFHPAEGVPATVAPGAARVAPRHVPENGVRELLLVEDNAVNRILAVRILEKAGYLVMVAGNGKEAIDILQRRSFGLVLMDVQMPEMDGLEATRLIRGGIEGVQADIPIVAMTAHALKGDRERCIAAGMTDYLAKPLKADELLTVVACHFHENSAPLSSSAGFRTADDTIDVAGTLQRLDGDVELLRELWEIFIEDAPRQWRELRECFQNGDCPGLLIQAHSIKGGSASIGATALQETAFLMEQACRNGELDAARALFPQMGAQLCHALEVLTTLHQAAPSGGKKITEPQLLKTG